jgi:hypothetical protein
MLQSYRRVETNGMLFDFEFNGKLYPDTELVFYTHMIKADTEEADRLCGSYLNRTNARHLCRYCHCPTEDADNPLANYKPKTEKQIRRLCERDDEQGLKEISQHNIKNAFHGLRFGLHNDHGIHGACPLEMLHALLLGIYPYVRDCFFAQMGKTSETAVQINALSNLYGQLYTRQADRDMPRTNFSRGIQKGKLMAKEYSGVILLIATILRSAKGRAILQSARKKNYNEDWLIGDWSLLVETLLQWEAFLKQKEMNRWKVRRFLDRKQRFIMYLIKKIVKRTEGMGLKILKFHAISHIANDIIINGVPMVADTGSNESHHKTTKVAAKMTKKDIQHFEKSTALRLWEFHLVVLALEEIEGRPLWEYWDGYYEFQLESDSEPEGDGKNAQMDIVDEENGAQTDSETNQKPTKIVTKGLRIRVSIDPDSGQPQYEFPGSRMEKTQYIGWDAAIVGYLLLLQTAVSDHLPTDFIEIRCEHKRDEVIFRGHPGYRGNGVWQDWVLVDWGDDGQSPAQIWCFVDLSKLEGSVNFGEMVIEKGVYAVVEGSQYYEEHDELYSSAIFKPIYKEIHSHDDGITTQRKFYLADVDAFVAPIVVVPNIGSHPDNEYLELKPRANWAEDFEEWLEIDDEEEIEED